MSYYIYRVVKIKYDENGDVNITSYDKLKLRQLKLKRIIK